MQQYTLYADVLFLINAFLDFILLFATAHFSGMKARIWRLAMAALLGGAYGLGAVFPQLAFAYILPFKLGFSLLMLFVSFGRMPLRKFARLTVYFYAVSFAMAGAVMGCSSLISSSSFGDKIYSPVNLGALSFAVIAALFLARFGIISLKSHLSKESLCVKAEIMCERRTAAFDLFFDTGNDLRDPVSGKEVMVAEYSAVREALPEGFRRFYEGHEGADPVTLFQAAASTGFGRRLRLIPFNAIGKENGMLLGFVADYLLVRGRTGEEEVLRDIVVCLYNKKLINTKGYKAILSPFAMDRREELVARRKSYAR